MPTTATQEDIRFVIQWKNRKTGQAFRKETVTREHAETIFDEIRADRDACETFVERTYTLHVDHPVRWFDLAAHMKTGRGDAERLFATAEEAQQFADSLRGDRLASNIMTPPPKVAVKVERSRVCDNTGRPI